MTNMEHEQSANSSSPQFDECGELPHPRLPACHFCHARKIKCDNMRPSCSSCTKHGEECMTLGIDDQGPFSRRYIFDLEEEIKSLSKELTAAPNSLSEIHSSISETSSTPQNHDRRVPSRNGIPHGISRQRRSSPQFVEGGGLSFMRHLFADSGWREHDPSLLPNLSKGPGPAEASLQPNALPAADEAQDLFDTYLNGSHVQNPFLLKRDIQELYMRVYPSEEAPASAACSSHDLFRAFMILAIGSVLPYRSGSLRHHPYGFYLSAMTHLDDSFLSRGISSVQDLLLIGRFAIYHHIGTSIWEITRLCMRLCIEQGLHSPPISTPQGNALNEQLRRRVFWECYMIDRYSSITLDRPVAIADKYIRVGFPMNANDEDIEAAGESSFHDVEHSLSSPVAVTEMSVFRGCLRLRQITSQIHSRFGDRETALGAQNGLLGRGAIHVKLDQLLTELQVWRRSMPIFESPKCLYEMQEWYDLLCLREKLLLVRKAIDLTPKRNNTPPKDVLLLCMQYANEVLLVFCGLFEKQKITYTRSYFQMLFTAGLSVMYCMSVVNDLDPLTFRNGTSAVIAGENALRRMGLDLPDAKSYVAVYEALRRHVLHKYSQNRLEDEFTQETNTHLPCDNTAHGAANGGPTAPESFMLPPGRSTCQHSRMTTENPSYDLNAQALFQNYLTDVSLSSGLETGTQGDMAVAENLLPSWDIFGDDALWNMEAGLNEYAYGDPSLDLFDLYNMLQ